jgi:ribonuclease HI
MDWYVDGSGWNGKRSAFCVKSGDFQDISEFTEPLTNNDMEYGAVIMALMLCRDGDTIYSDSQLVVNQVVNNWKVNALNLKEKNKLAKQLLKERDAKLVWIPREQNLAGKVFE